MHLAMRIAILCNDRLAFPALDYVLSTGFTVAVAMPAREHENQMLVQSKCRLANIPFELFSRRDFNTRIVEWLEKHKPDVVLVKTFPFLIPEQALRLPRYGFINFHYAPLPHWRGANPLFWMIRNGATKGGVTVHQMTKE